MMDVFPSISTIDLLLESEDITFLILTISYLFKPNYNP